MNFEGSASDMLAAMAAAGIKLPETEEAAKRVAAAPASAPAASCDDPSCTHDHSHGAHEHGHDDHGHDHSHEHAHEHGHDHAGCDHGCDHSSHKAEAAAAPDAIVPDSTNPADWFFSPASAGLSPAGMSTGLSNLLGTTFIQKSNLRAPVAMPDRFAGAVVAVYFSAHWCPPCRQYTPMLASFYAQAAKANIKFEVVFVS